jgi:protein-tyrosine phosphatase
MLYNYFDNVNNIIPGDDNINGGPIFNNIVSGQIWLGNMKAALDPKFIKENKISVIINASVDIPFIFDVIDPAEYGISKLETYRIPVYDSLLEHDIYIMEQYLHKVLPFLLKKLLKEKKNILIHCHAKKILAKKDIFKIYI